MTTPSIGFGAFLSPFHPPGENPTLSLRRDMELIEWLDELGLEEAWVGEHHSTGWGLIGSPEVFLAAAAERTRHIRLGTGVASLPYHHPFMVATRAVQLDHMTRGRFMLGMGAGSLPSDAHMLGIEPADTRRRTAEAITAITHLLTSDEPLTMKTDWFLLQDAILQLRPYTRPTMPLAVSSAASPFGMRLAGRHGLSPLSFGLPRPGAGPDGVAAQWQHAEVAAAEAGRSIERGCWRINVPVYVADSREQALQDLRPSFSRFQNGYWHDTVGLPVAPGVIPGREMDAAVETGRFIAGSPQDCIDGIEALFQATGGFGRLLVTVQDWAPPQKVRRSFELLARYVVPHFDGSVRNIAASQAWVAANRANLAGKAYQAHTQAMSGTT